MKKYLSVLVLKMREKLHVSDRNFQFRMPTWGTGGTGALRNWDLRKQFSLCKVLDFEFLSSQNRETVVLFGCRDYKKVLRRSKTPISSF